MKKNVITITVIGILFLSSLIVIPASSDMIKTLDDPITVYVDEDNIEGPWDGSIEYPYQFIQEAINNATEGDTVFVYNGTYYENVEINTENISLIGEDKNTTIIDGGGTSDVIQIFADNVTISGFTIQDSGDFFTYMKISSCNGTIVLGNIFLNNKDNEGNRALKITCSENITVSDNHFIDNNGGIDIEHSLNNIISNNVITSNVRGIRLIRSSGNSIINNKIENNVNGIVVQFDSENNEVYSNIISNNILGIRIEITNHNNVSYNSISKNFIGIKLYFASGIYIYKNNFFINIRNVILCGDDNNFDKNYWNRPRILPKLIFGHLRSQPGISEDKYFFDFDLHPAREPYDI